MKNKRREAAMRCIEEAAEKAGWTVHKDENDVMLCWEKGDVRFPVDPDDGLEPVIYDAENLFFSNHPKHDEEEKEKDSAYRDLWYALLKEWDRYFSEIKKN